MPRLLKKIPNFRLPKFHMKEIGEIEELKVEYTAEDYAKLQEKVLNKKNRSQLHEGTDYKTVKEIFDRSTNLFAERDFILQVYNKKIGFEGRSYGQFRKDVINFGTGLTKALKLEDKKIVIISETTYQWYVSYISCLCGAGVAVPLDKELPENEFENCIRRAGAAAIIYSPKMKDVVKKLANKCDTVEYCIEMYSDEGFDEKDKRFVGFNYVKDEGRVFTVMGDNSLMEKEIDPEAFAVLIFTSGTTSESKGVMLCQKNLAANVNAVTPYVVVTPEDRLFSVLPLHHTYESTIGFIFPMAVGASIAVCQGLKHIVNDMKETQPTAIIAVPLLLETLHKRITQTIEKSGKANIVNTMIRLTNSLKKNTGVDVKRKVFKEIYDNLGGKIRLVVSAAAPIEPSVGKWFEDIGIMFLQGYGLTETAPIAAVTPDFDTRVGSAGKVVVCDEIMIANPNEKGEGEILIKGDTVMLGYYEAPELTAEAIVDGWFHSGDIGFLDEDNFVYITGRIKNVIVTQNGKNIYPEEIEGLLSRVPEVAECMVYGKEVSGEKELIITAKVIPDYDQIEALHGANRKNPEEPFTEEEIYKIIWNQIKQVNRKLTNYKCIKKLEIKTDAFEKTTTMKIKRYVEIQKDKAQEN
ncbi:MAG: AMP-binding protein [Firmicutes bacterium]|nr:AMP-binding protein [Bacillota bacterium]